MKTVGGRENDSGASLGHFQTFGFLFPIFEFHNLAARHVDSSARARRPTESCVLWMLVLGTHRHEFQQSSHRCRPQIASSDSSHWLASVCYLSRCIFPSQHLGLLAVFIGSGYSVWTITQWVWEEQGRACVLSGEARLVGKCRQWAGRDVIRYTLLLL